MPVKLFVASANRVAESRNVPAYPTHKTGETGKPSIAETRSADYLGKPPLLEPAYDSLLSMFLLHIVQTVWHVFMAAQVSILTSSGVSEVEPLLANTKLDSVSDRSALPIRLKLST